MSNQLTKDEVEMAKTEGINDLSLLDAVKNAYITLNSQCDQKDKAKKILAKAIEMEEKRLNWEDAAPRGYSRNVNWRLMDAAGQAMKSEVLKDIQKLRDARNAQTDGNPSSAEEIPAPTMLSAPWYTYYRKLKALFEADPEVRICFHEDTNTVALEAATVEKAEAIRELLPREVRFGNVLLTVHVRAVPQSAPNINSIIRAAFKGNPNFVDCLTSIGPSSVTFVIFTNKVVQIWNDDITDANGLISTLLEAVASEVLVLPNGVYCNTAPGMDIIR